MNCYHIEREGRIFLQEQYEKGDPHIFLAGTSPIMISAPHTVEQIRHNKRKRAEPYTGVLARMLHEQAGYHAVIKERCLFDDANYDEMSFYREELIFYIKQHGIQLLLDLHIMNSGRRQAVEMATGGSENIQGNWLIIDRINEAAESCGLSIATDNEFFALNPNCVAAHIARECGIPAIQMEINWRELQVTPVDCSHFRNVFRFLQKVEEKTVTAMN